MTLKTKAVIFDLDGTLLDTLADLADSANHVLASRGYPTHPREAYKWFVGDGSKVLMTRALPEDQRRSTIIDTCLDALITEYAQRWDKATRPYDGIVDLVDLLQSKSIHFAVVTNKPHRFAAVMMDHYFKGRPFFPILGQQTGIPKKPHPQQALVAADRMGVSPEGCLFLGDSAVDMETAQRAGMQPVGAGWGFRSTEELNAAGALTVISHPLALLEIL